VQERHEQTSRQACADPSAERTVLIDVGYVGARFSSIGTQLARFLAQPALFLASVELLSAEQSYLECSSGLRYRVL
jgi:hypothetical protein